MFLYITWLYIMSVFNIYFILYIMSVFKFDFFSRQINLPLRNGIIMNV